MGLFGKKDKKQEVKPEKQEIKLPTLETILKGNPVEEIKIEQQPKQEMPQPKQELLPKQFLQQPKQEMPQNEQQMSQTKEELPASLPLFVKLEKYNSVLDTIAELKNCIIAMKDGFVVLDRLEVIREESFNSLQDTIKKFEEKVSFLNSELLRPPGYMEEVSLESHKSEELQGVLKELKTQVDQLKNELKQVA